MDTNTLLRIYQTYSLEKISALSKQSLAAQYAQNEQLVQLKNELAANITIANKILKNQIRELERQEKTRFYKNLIFNLKLVIDKIENQPNDNFRLFLSSLFLKPIEAYAKESIDNLEEVNDKEYAQKIIERVKSISLSNLNLEQEYSLSVWSSYVSAKEAYEDNKNLIEISKKKKEVDKIGEEISKRRKKVIDDSKYRKKFNIGCFAFSILLFLYVTGALVYAYIIKDPNASGGIPIVILAALILLFVWAGIKYSDKGNNKKQSQKNGQELELKIAKLQNEIDELAAKDKSAKEQYMFIYSAINSECCDWESQTNEIIKLLPHDKKDVDSFDPMLVEVARLVVCKQDGSTNFVQRKFEIGFNRARRMMDQLEIIGVVGAANESNSRDVLIPDEKTLNIVLSKCNL